MTDRFAERLRSFGAASGRSTGTAQAASRERARFIRLETDDPSSFTNLFTSILIGPSFAKGNVTAIMYDPHLPYCDENGQVEHSEEELVRHLNMMDQTRSYREPAYREALMKLQSRKTSLGMKRDTPIVTDETIFGKKTTTEAAPALAQK